MPWMAVEKAYAFDGPQGKASLLDLFEGRRQLIVYRAFFEPGRVRLARPCLPRLLDGGRPGRPPRPPERPRHHARLRLARAAGRHRAPEGADGLGDALVHHHRQLRRRLRRRPVARPQRVHPRRRRACSAPTSSTAAATRRWAASGATSTSTPLGRQETWEDSPEGYPQTPTVQVVELARQLRRRTPRPTRSGSKSRTPARRRSASGRRRKREPRLLRRARTESARRRSAKPRSAARRVAAASAAADGWPCRRADLRAAGAVDRVRRRSLRCSAWACRTRGP